MATSLGYMMSSPVLFINMGCEIIYILDQRLRAFTVDIEKQQKVLNDILKALFNQQIVQQIFQPQKSLNYNFFTQLFKKVINCSIMNMNEASLNKLQDLTHMGVKYQFTLSQSPIDIYFITLNHLTGVMNILQQGSSLQYVKQCEKMFIQHFANKSPTFFMQVKAEVMKFLQVKQIRIYKFIFDNKCQNNDGSFIIQNNQGVSAPFVGKPGIVEMYDNQGNVKKKLPLVLKVAKNFTPNDATGFFEQSSTQLGKNMFSDTNSMTGQMHTGFENDQQMKRAMKINESQAKQNMNQFASIIRGQQEDEDDDTAFTISSISKGNQKSNNNTTTEEKDDMLQLQDQDFQFDFVSVGTGDKAGQKKMEATMNQLFDDLDIKQDKEEEQEGEQEQDGDDLLDMMDNL